MYRIFCAVVLRCEQTDKETYRHIDKLITILCTSTRNEVNTSVVKASVRF